MTRLTTAFDIPSMRKAMIGFDHMFDEMERRYVNSVSNGYPPYNIVKVNDDEYTISLAVAGFGMDDLEITKDRNLLVVEGKSKVTEEESVNYVYKGIGSRNFRREFTLADYVEVESANLELGILTVNLKRVVPEELQPKRIKVNGV